VLRSPAGLLLPSLAVVLTACSHATRPTADEVQVTPDGRRIITAEAIAHSGARTAWDALRRTVPFYTFRENSDGRPSSIEHRGRSSIVLRDQPMIVLDNVQVEDFTVLGEMPAADLLDIEILSGIDATTYYGTNATKGVIRLRTKTREN
jgi:outer membrane cobalamin receptor